PSSLQPSLGLTVWDASSSHFTLWVMLLATVVFLPIVLAYTTYVYRVMSGAVTPQTVSRDPNAYCPGAKAEELDHVVLLLDPRPRAGLRLRDPQRDVVRAA